MKNAEIGIDMKEAVGGRYRPVVRNRDGSIARDYGWQGNLILPAGVGTSGTANMSWYDMMLYCHAGSGSTPNKVLLAGTFSQTGTTVTRTTGTGVFTSGNVNDFVKFATGETAKITAFTNSVTVTVDRSQTVAAAALTVYDCSRVTLDTWVKQTITNVIANVTTQDTEARSAKFQRTWDFAFETSAQTYTELGVSRLSGSSAQLLSRIVLDSPVNVDADQFLQVQFAITAVATNYGTSQPMTVNITGWPRPYNIQSIVANGTYFDVVLDAAHHYATGRPIIITGALPATTPVSSYSSTGSDFTVTTSSAHGKAPGDSIVIAGATPSAYNGTWTVATTPTATTLTVTSAINPGAGTGGTLRLATPGTWFDGTWTIASFPNSTTIRVSSAITPPAAGVAGTVTNSTAANAIISGFAYDDRDTTNVAGALDLKANKACYLYNEAQMKSSLQYGVTTSWSSAITGAATATSQSYDVANRKYSYVRTFPSAVGNGYVRQVALYGGPGATNGAIAVTFDERQVKESGFQLVLNWSFSWQPDLS